MPRRAARLWPGRGPVLTAEQVGKSIVEIVLIAALQHLPARQLILRDVLDWRAAEVAAPVGTDSKRREAIDSDWKREAAFPRYVGC